MYNQPHSRRTPITTVSALVVAVILLALAVPTFAGARDRAANRAAQADLTSALKAQLSYRLVTGAFTQDPAALGAEARGLTWSAWPTGAWDASTCRQRVCVLLGGGTAAGPGGLDGRQQATGDPDAVCLLSQSGAGEFFQIMVVTRPAETIHYFHGLSDGINRTACDSRSARPGRRAAW